MSRTILVQETDGKFQIEIPDDAELTFGPWSPPTKEDRGFRSDEQRRGTLRVYSHKKAEILACFAGVTSFRDVSRVSYRREVVQLKGETLWESDEHGYQTSSREKRERAWVPELHDSGD